MRSRSSADDSSKALRRLVIRLTEARKKAVPRITQADLASKLHKSHQSAIAKIEGGEHELRLPDFVRWARIVGEDPLKLLEEFEENLEVEGRTRTRVLLRKRSDANPSPEEVQASRQPRERKLLKRRPR